MENKEKNKEILSRLKRVLSKDENVFINNGDLSDLGNLIGIAIGSQVENNSNGYDPMDLYSGIEHGIDLAINHSEYIDLE